MMNFLPSLSSICSAATITEERKKNLDFSQPYFDIKLAIAARDESSIRSFADIGDRIIAVRIATIAEDFVRPTERST